MTSARARAGARVDGGGRRARGRGRGRGGGGARGFSCTRGGGMEGGKGIRVRGVVANLLPTYTLVVPVNSVSQVAIGELGGCNEWFLRN
jgi:hypothetical protein